MKKSKVLGQVLAEKLDLTLKSLEGLTQQLRETRDYSNKSEIIFLLNELVLEQLDGKKQENENISNTNNSSR